MDECHNLRAEDIPRLCDELTAKDKRIAELEAENARMRAALQQLADQADANWTREVARAGLTGKITVTVE